MSDQEQTTLLAEIRDLLRQQIDLAQQTLKNQEQALANQKQSIDRQVSNQEILDADFAGFAVGRGIYSMDWAAAVSYAAFGGRLI